MSDASINQVLQQMRILAAKTEGGLGGVNTESTTPTPGGEFGHHLKNAIDNVNDLQQNAKQLGEAYTMGSPDVSLIDVTLASQKSGLAFTAMVQVRNKVVAAYQEVMNMNV